MKQEEFISLIGPVFGHAEKHWADADNDRKGTLDFFEISYWLKNRKKY